MITSFKIFVTILESLRDELLSDCLITYVEQDIFANIDNKPIMQWFLT